MNLVLSTIMCVCKLYSHRFRNWREVDFPKLFKTDIGLKIDRVWVKTQLDQAALQIPQHWDPHIRVEFMKTTQRTKVLELRKMNQNSCSTEAIVGRINSVTSKPILNREDFHSIEELKLELARAEEQEEEKMRIKAGVKWREEGERSGKYFMSRYKTRLAATAMHVLKVGNEMITGSKDLIKFVRIFYARLYGNAVPERSQDEQFSEQFFSNCPRLDNEVKASLGSPLTVEELKLTLRTCKDSALGFDDIPYS